MLTYPRIFEDVTLNKHFVRTNKESNEGFLSSSGHIPLTYYTKIKDFNSRNRGRKLFVVEQKGGKNVILDQIWRLKMRKKRYPDPT